MPDFGAVYLVGNHDAWFLSFLVDAKIGQSWLRYGGDATLHSYGVRVGMVRDDLQYFERLQAELAEKVPPEHLAFLRGLEVTFQIGDYLFRPCRYSSACTDRTAVAGRPALDPRALLCPALMISASS